MVEERRFGLRREQRGVRTSDSGQVRAPSGTPMKCGAVAVPSPWVAARPDRRAAAAALRPRWRMWPPWLLGNSATRKSPAWAMLRCIHLRGRSVVHRRDHVWALVGVAATARNEAWMSGSSALATALAGQRGVVVDDRRGQVAEGVRRPEDHVGVAEQVDIAAISRVASRFDDLQPPDAGPQAAGMVEEVAPLDELDLRQPVVAGAGTRRRRRRIRCRRSRSPDELAGPTAPPSVSSSSFRKRVVQKLTVISAIRTDRRTVRRPPDRQATEVVTASTHAWSARMAVWRRTALTSVAARRLLAEPGHDRAGRPHGGTLAS